MSWLSFHSVWQALAARLRSSLIRTDSLETLSPTNLQVILPSLQPSKVKCILHSHYVPCLTWMRFPSPFPNKCKLLLLLQMLLQCSEMTILFIYQQTIKAYLFWYFFFSKCLQVPNDFCFHPSIHTKLSCAYSHVFLYNIHCSFLLWKTLRKQRIFYNIQPYSLYSSASISCNSFFLSQFGCCCQLPTEQEAL